MNHERESKSEAKSLGFGFFFHKCSLLSWLAVAPNMMITKANVKESQGKFICLSITTAKAKNISRYSFVISGQSKWGLSNGA